MRLLHTPGAVEAVFDDQRLISYAGLEPVMRLAEQCGLRQRVRQKVRLPGPVGANPGGKVATIVAGMLTDADSIDDLDRVRHGGMGLLFDDVYAPSTLGSFLRAFTHGHVRQLESACRQVLVELAARTPLLPAAGVLTFIDIDSLLRPCYGKAKQGASFGHAKVGGYQILRRGYSPLIATISTPQAAPVVATTRLRAGRAGSSRGAVSLAVEAIGTAKAIGAVGQILLRADSAFYAAKLVSACRRHEVRFSITVPVTAAIRSAIAAIADDAWTDISYRHAVWDEDEQRWISDAQIAETGYTAFAGTKNEVTGRLIVRRVKRLNPKAAQGQDQLFTLWRYHAVFTDSRFVLVQAEQLHRGHAIQEQTLGELIDGPLAHLPSGDFAANAAWLSLAGLAHNLTRAAGTLASAAHARARPATIRAQLICIAARIARRARKIILHLPVDWPWQPAWQQLFTAVHTTPA
jgi:Transposase DDE domain group 1